MRTDVSYLYALRRGDISDVISTIEEDLSTEIWCLALSYPNEALSQDKNLGILRIAASYRAQHPYKTENVEKNRLVESLLAKANSTSEVSAPAVQNRPPTTN